MSNKYKLVYFADLLSIPQERLADCLAELPHILETARMVYELNKAVMPSVTPFDVLPSATWVDDKKNTLTINLGIMEKSKC